MGRPFPLVLIGTALAATALTPLAAPVAAVAAVPPALVYGASDKADWGAIFALDLLEQLDLSPQQVRLMLPVYEDACRLYTAYLSDVRRLYAEALATYPAYRDQKRENVGVSPEVESAAVSAHAAIREWQHRYQADRLALETRLRDEVFTARQQRTAEAYVADPQRIARQSGAVGIRAQRQAPKDAGEYAAGNRQAPTSSLEHRLEALQAERERLDDFRHPGGGAIAEHLLSPAAADWLYGGLGLRPPPAVREAQQLWRYGTPAYPRSRMAEDADRVEDLKNEINDWNLVNALHITRGQTERLARLVAEAISVQEQRQATDRPQSWLDQRWVALENEVQAILTPGQRQALAEFSSCFTGKPSLRNPVRVGQASVADEMEKWLAKVRRMSEPQIQAAVRERVEQDEQRWTGPLSPSERSARVAALTSAARRAAAMSDVDFALDRAALAESAATPNRSQELNEEAQRIRQRLGKPGKAARLMFTPRFLGLLNQRAYMLAAQDVRRPTPATEGPQAENPGAGCALPPNK